MNVAQERPVREIVTEHPESVPVFERFGIDYCCGGSHTLHQACAKRNIDISEVVAAIEALDAGKAQTPWQQGSLSELCHYIAERHHGYARQQLPLIRELLAKVQHRHGASHPEVFFIAELISAAEGELMHHFHCEEEVLFPYIILLEQDSSSTPPPMIQEISQPVQRMLTEHAHTGEEISLLREKTNNYLPPADACTTFRALWKALEDLEKDLHLHIHLENNILFPRALALTEQPA